MRRVAVTGLGIVCALGEGVTQVWSSLQSGRSGIAPIQAVDTATLRFRNGAEARMFHVEHYFPGNKSDFLDRFARFAVVAARQAVEDSGARLVPERTAVLLGSCVGGQNAQDAGFVDLYRDGKNRVHPLTIPKTMGNAGVSHVCMELGITGPAMTINTACSSANHAIGQAFAMVRSGQADLALAGGSEAPFSYGFLKAWEAMRVVSSDTCRPFSQDRSGMILGEGGAVLVLEPADAAEKRGATIYGEIAGFGMSADAHHLTQPSVEGPALAMRNALADAQLDPAAVGHINAHGTATLTNDPIESRAIRAVFGERTPEVLVTSTKSMHGHALGAAGAIEAIAALLALQQQCVPPTANFTARDPECDVNVVTEARAARLEAALSNSFAFGGLNAVLAFRRAR
ncbi:MAG TPA: beta-ketoacyl-[acyl-carrier-protein] synthase family protein [Terriglobales bacterium]|nr:beta-ketoacyl-[acyl-carrier-protein] synthase family protein [Terriglobales bacterium]